MSTSREQTQRAQALLDEAQAKVERLRGLKPFFLDVSLRENAVGGSAGQLLEDKVQQFEAIRAFGVKNILLGTLNYSLPDEPQVDDDFMQYLRDQQADVGGCFAFTSPGTSSAGRYSPDSSQLKLKAYGVPNTVHEIYLSDEGMAGLYDLDTLVRSLPDSIAWLRSNIRGAGNEAPRIIVNLVDGCDAFVDDSARVFSVLELLAAQPIEGVSFQDDRGTFLPFQVGAFTAAARQFLPRSLSLLVHIHGGSGFENAAVIEALLNGADGVWGALPKTGPVVGHASLGELIANLVRVGNASMNDYRLDQLMSLAQSASVEDLHMLGRDAYRLTLSFFRQKAHRPMDLVPEAIGGRYGYRVCPVVSDPPVIAGRLAEVTGRPAESFSQDVLVKMMRLMRRDLRAGVRTVYDEPEQLLRLHARAAALSGD